MLGNNQALDRFLASVEKRAFRRARIATKNNEEAFDIVQDAMLKLVKKYANEEPEAWQALFYRILQNCIMDWYRRTAVRNRFRSWFAGSDDEGDPIQRVEDFQARSPEQLAQTQQGIEGLEQALQKLPLKQQQVFLLRAWEGLSVTQTAAAMGCSDGTVKTHYFRARASLIKTLGIYADE